MLPRPQHRRQAAARIAMPKGPNVMKGKGKGTFPPHPSYFDCMYVYRADEPFGLRRVYKSISGIMQGPILQPGVAAFALVPPVT
jgi:hypothetical protein